MNVRAITIYTFSFFPNLKLILCIQVVNYFKYEGPPAYKREIVGVELIKGGILHRNLYITRHNDFSYLMLSRCEFRAFLLSFQFTYSYKETFTCSAVLIRTKTTSTWRTCLLEVSGFLNPTQKNELVQNNKLYLAKNEASHHERQMGAISSHLPTAVEKIHKRTLEKTTDYLKALRVPRIIFWSWWVF